jgi:hypothetical protein
MWRITVGLFIAFIALASIGFWYYKDSQARIEALRANNALLLAAAETNQATINEMLLQQAINQQLLKELTDKLLEAETYLTELRRILHKHDLTRLAEEKPGLIERRINEATRKVFDSIMLSTGAR